MVNGGVLQSLFTQSWQHEPPVTETYRFGGPEFHSKHSKSVIEDLNKRRIGRVFALAEAMKMQSLSSQVGGSSLTSVSLSAARVGSLGPQVLLGTMALVGCSERQVCRLIPLLVAKPRALQADQLRTFGASNKGVDRFSKSAFCSYQRIN